VVYVLEFPLVVFAISLVGLWLSVRAGSFLQIRHPRLEKGERDDFSLILAASLTLLGLLIGFTFSMANSRYDLRKQCEAVEANAIGTEYDRVGLLPEPDATKVRGLLKEYVDLRVLHYYARDPKQNASIAARVAELQNQMWSAVEAKAGSQPAAVMALVLSGMNEVIDSQGFSQAAWWNRIPAEAWMLMALIAIICSLLLGYGASRNSSLLLFMVPLTVSIAFALIVDIDSPRGGGIRIHPRNLESVAQSFHQR
jgi:hypothetical protein